MFCNEIFKNLRKCIYAEMHICRTTTVVCSLGCGCFGRGWSFLLFRYLPHQKETLNESGVWAWIDFIHDWWDLGFPPDYWFELVSDARSIIPDCSVRSTRVRTHKLLIKTRLIISGFVKNIALLLPFKISNVQKKQKKWITLVRYELSVPDWLSSK